MRSKYQHLLNRALASKYSKSRYLHVYIYFLEYLDPDDINFEEIAHETKLPVNIVRSCSRPAQHNDSIADALVDIGVYECDIPEWFAASNTLRRMRKAEKKSPPKVPARLIPNSQMESPGANSKLLYLNLPNLARTPEEVEEARIKDRMLAQIAEYNRAREEAIQIIRREINQASEGERREKQKEQDAEDLKEKVKATILYSTLLRNFQFNQVMYAIVMSQPLHPTNLKKDFYDMIQQLSDVFINFIKDLNKRKQIPNVNNELLLLEPRDWSDLNDSINAIIENKPSPIEEIKTIFEVMNDFQEKNRRMTYEKYGDLIKPPEIIWPPGYKPVELFHGPRGEMIKKRINLDHLRK